MNNTLNIPLIEQRCQENGLNQTAIAQQLDVSRAAVSKWFTGKSFPRPSELLKLGKLLQLRHRELVTMAPMPHEPVVAFRRRGTCKTTDLHVTRAKDMGRLLTQLVPYLEVDPFMCPSSLKSPSTRYDYLQDLALRLRRDMQIGETEPIHFEHLIDHYRQHQAVIVPVMWGRKTKHENALHIHLPESQTTWVYLNLDVLLLDFKFWIAHELGHVLSIDLLREGKIDEAEDFADAFAGALLFPAAAAKVAYSEYSAQKTQTGRIACLRHHASEHVISPNSVYIEIEKYAEAKGMEFNSVEPRALHTSIATFHKNVQHVTEKFFDDTPTADHFMRVVQEVFKTPFYKVLGDYIREQKPGLGSVATLLGVGPLDADAYLQALRG